MNGALLYWHVKWTASRVDPPRRRSPPPGAGALLAIGLAAGSVLAFAAAPFAESLVFGVPPHDVRPVGLACVLLAAAAIAASYLPARRAAGLEPLRALREE
jgi:ABC-type lipoprotein release transport system permease subunit